MLSLKMKFVTRKKGQGKWSIILCHYRLGMEPQTRNCGARQGHDPPAVPLSAIIIKSTFFCLPLKTLLKKRLSGKIMHQSELDFPFFFFFTIAWVSHIIIYAGESPGYHLSNCNITGRLQKPIALSRRLGFSLTLREAHQESFRCHLAGSSHSLEGLLGP